VLQPILESVRATLPDLIGAEESWSRTAAAADPAQDFTAALAGSGLSVIAEIKRRSPSAGPIAPVLDPVALGMAYQAGGAAAISVLTEADHFGGSTDDLGAVAAACHVPILRKDFILHPVQVAQARAIGADAVLLIAAILDDALLESLIAAATGYGMTALVEAHDATEVARAAAGGATVIGVNNRDLRTFIIDLTTAERLRPLIPTGVVAVAESGVTDVVGARRMKAVGYDAILVGQAAAQAPDPAGFIEALTRAV
jgi:indole-3-glycerol phosphate synthase